MDLFQWAITTVVGILGILAGRFWERYDRRVMKDKEVYNKIIETLGDTIQYAQKQDFGGYFTWNYLDGLAVCRRERKNDRSQKEKCLKSQKIAVKVV